MEYKVPVPEYGAIFMSNNATKRNCLKHRVFGLPQSMINFVKEVKKGMILFLFEYERRQLYGVYRATSDGEANIIPHAFSSSGMQFSAQVRFTPIWNCSPLSENEFRDAIRENYFSARKFHFGLSDEQVHRLLRLFTSRKLKSKLPLRDLTTGVSNRVDQDHIEPSNVDYERYPRSFHGVKRVDDDVYYGDNKRRIGYDRRLLADSATQEIGFSGDDRSSDDRTKSELKFNGDYVPLVSGYRRNRSDLFLNNGTVSDDWKSYLDDRDRKKSHLDPNVNSTTVSDHFVSSPYNLKGISKDGRLRTREISRHESKFCAATDDVCFLSTRKRANEECVDSYRINDFDELVPATQDFQRPLTVAEGTVYSNIYRPETEFPQSTEAQNLGPSFSKYHDATITRIVPDKHEFPGSYTYEVERGSNFVDKHSAYNVDRENNVKGIYPDKHEFPGSYTYEVERGSNFVHKRSPYNVDGENNVKGIYPEFTKRRPEPTSEAMDQNRSFGYPTALIPRRSITRHFTRDDIEEHKNWRSSGKYQFTDDELSAKHIRQGHNGTKVGRRSHSPNTHLLHQGKKLENLDLAINDQCEGNLLTDSRNSRRSVFSRLSSTPKVRLLRRQEADQRSSDDEYVVDTSVDEIMDMLYEDQKIIQKKPLNRKPSVRKVSYGETNWSSKHATAIKNDAEQHDLMMQVNITGATNEETENHVLAETRVVDFKRRRETNIASEEANANFNKDEKANANELKVVENAQENSSETDKPCKRRKLVRPTFDENNSRSDLNCLLPTT